MSSDDFVNRELPRANYNTPTVETPTPTPTPIPSPTSTTVNTPHAINDANVEVLPAPSRGIFQRSAEESSAIHEYMEQRSANPTIPRNRLTIDTNSNNNNYNPNVTHTTTSQNSNNGSDFIDQALNNVRENAQARIRVNTESIDVYNEITEQVRALSIITRQIINQLATWSFNHPYIALTLVSTVSGVGVFLFRSRAAMIFARPFVNNTPAGLPNIIDGFLPRPATTQQAANQFFLRQGLAFASQIGGITAIVIIFVRGLRR
jgi:hypothetical protein